MTHTDADHALTMATDGLLSDLTAPAPTVTLDAAMLGRLVAIAVRAAVKNYDQGQGRRLLDMVAVEARADRRTADAMVRAYYDQQGHDMPGSDQPARTYAATAAALARNPAKGVGVRE